MTDSSMLKYQYSTILDQLILLQLHAEDPNCPCSLKGEGTGEQGEWCEPKHTRAIVALARETISMESDGARVDYLEGLVLSGSELLSKMEEKLCGKEVDFGDLVVWARDKRKPLEAMVYEGFCNLAPVDEALVREVAKTFQPFYPERKLEPTLVRVGPGLKGIIPPELAFTKVQTKLIRSRSYDPAKAPVIKQASDLQPYFRLMRNADQEWLLAIYADHRGHVVGADEISVGERFGTTLSLDTVYRSAILLNASKIFLAHNHPSGISEPSEDDINTFEALREFCPMLNIAVEDFFVVGANEDYSIRGKKTFPAPSTLLEEVARMFKEEPRWCFGVKAVSKELGGLARNLGIAKDKAIKLKKKLELPINICRGQAEMFEATSGVLDPYGSRCRDPETGQWVYSEECGFEPAGITTTALGMDGLTQYEFEFRLVSADKLVVSHDPFTFAPNPNYPEELQPRLRERAATKLQVEKIAATLEPDAVIVDFHVIDRGTPIIGPDMVVEAGNGRVMGIIRAAADYPEKYADYKARLRERAHDYGLNPKDVDLIENPLLVRVRLTEVDRPTFTQEANQAATIAPSAIENARTDAQKITLSMLQELVVGEDESLEDALRAPKNQTFAKSFLSTLPETVQAALVDAQGYLNRDGVHRMAMAVFVSAFQGDAGLRLAERAFESLSMDVRNSINGIARSLGPMAQAESLIRAGERDTSLSIGDDLAQTVNVYSAIKRNPALTVEKYLAQEQIFARELTPFQEGILIILDEHRRSPKKLASIFTAYAEGVIKAPPPAQAALFPGAEVTKEGLWESAVKAPEVQPVLMEVVKMFDKRDNGSGVEGEVTRACKEIGHMLKGQPWGAESMLAWAERLKVQADRADGCRSLQEAAYTKAYEVIKIAQPMLKPAKVKEATLHQSALSSIGSAAITGVGIGAGFKFIDWLTKKFKEKGGELGAPMKLLTKEIRDKLPPLYSQEKVEDPMVWVKFFTPDSNWTWYGIEFDGEDRFYGWVVGLEKELGYFSLSELESARGPLGLPIERDKWFKPQPLSEVKKLHQHERGEMGDEKSSAGFPLNPREEQPGDINHFYQWTNKASGDEVLRELCERADYLGAHLCLAKEGDAVDKEWLEKCPYIGTEDVYSELGRLRFLCWKLTDKLPSSVMIFREDERINPKQFCLSKDAWFELQNAISKGRKPEALEIMWSKGIVLKEGEMGEDYEPSVYATRRFGDKTYVFYKHVASDMEAMKLVNQLFENWKVLAIATPDNDIWLPKKDAPLLINPEFLKRAEGQAGMGLELPAYVDVFKTTIAKHYRPTEDFHEGSIRVLKPEKDILVYLGCLLADDWDGKRCSPNPTVVKTIVPNTKKYRDELDHLKLVHPEVKVNYQEKEVGTEPVVAEGEQELEALIDEARKYPVAGKFIEASIPKKIEADVIYSITPKVLPGHIGRAYIVSYGGAAPRLELLVPYNSSYTAKTQAYGIREIKSFLQNVWQEAKLVVSQGGQELQAVGKALKNAEEVG